MTTTRLVADGYYRNKLLPSKGYTLVVHNGFSAVSVLCRQGLSTISFVKYSVILNFNGCNDTIMTVQLPFISG